MPQPHYVDGRSQTMENGRGGKLISIFRARTHPPPVAKCRGPTLSRSANPCAQSLRQMVRRWRLPETLRDLHRVRYRRAKSRAGIEVGVETWATYG